MICPNCGAYLGEKNNYTNCPNCNEPLPPEKHSKSKTGTKKTCLTCGCGCLIIIIIIVLALALMGYIIINFIEQNISDKPIETPVVTLDKEAKKSLRMFRDKVNEAIVKHKKQTFTLTLNQDEMNYLLQNLINHNEMIPKLKLDVSLNGDIINSKYSFKLDAQKYLNGAASIFLNIKNEKVEFSLEKFTIGNLKLSKSIISTINSQINDQDVQQMLDNLNNSKPEKFHFIIKTFEVKDSKANITFKTK